MPGPTPEPTWKVTVCEFNEKVYGDAWELRVKLEGKGAILAGKTLAERIREYLGSRIEGRKPDDRSQGS